VGDSPSWESKSFRTHPPYQLLPLTEKEVAAAKAHAKAVTK